MFSTKIGNDKANEEVDVYFWKIPKFNFANEKQEELEAVIQDIETKC
jgi:hypothetical protein